MTNERLCTLLLFLVAGCGDTTGNVGRSGSDLAGAAASATSDASSGGDGAGGSDGSGGGGNSGTPLLDGAPGSQLSGFNANAPEPLIVLAHRVQPDAWVIGLVDIDANGTLSGVTNCDRVRAFSPGSASLILDAPFPGSKIAGWSPDTPTPLVVLVRRSGGSTWVTAIVDVLDDGTLTGLANVDRVRVWRIDGAPPPFTDGSVANAVVPGWNPSSPGPMVLGASTNGTPGWIVAAGSIDAGGHLGDLVADRVVGWKL
jgi:hypothetical protein